MIKIGSLKEVCAIDENKVMTTLRKGYNKVGDALENGGEIFGRLAGGVSNIQNGNIPFVGRGVRGFVNGIHKGYHGVDDFMNKNVWKPAGKLVGAYDDEKENKEDKKDSKKKK